ncbi:hypothetical protein CI109_103296 [Kwoniella shandongensis]|uniref:AB hydrolase-1 domain-containing protein n=1 Tax=Kwoniella shandongensis TaxID=1734106 RepID=A0A5M6BTQ1_9TREE|nr:uncharacterized protein CI109_006032 [Kwoniella shandongensis]KAA5525581.1 hypothetical protein CI109_006032 [Kwoniella shandongensis]
MPAFEEFTHGTVTVRSKLLNRDLEIACKKKGDGEGLLLLHGYPQTSHIWHKIANRLAEKYTVVATDLRGYGKSSKPRGSDKHEEYSKREMASDQVQVMKHFGFDNFSVIGHDRGGRVAHRLALDHPDQVTRLMLLDIAPTLYMYDHTDMAFAKAYWHWFFLIQPTPGPENMILAGPEQFWATAAARASHQGVKWSEEDVEEYKTSSFRPETVHANCEDYRAAATIDLEHDRADQSAGRKLTVPKLRIIWGSKGVIERYDDVLAIWRGYCEEGKVDVSGKGLDCGHYIAEEQPEGLMKEIYDFMS